MAHPALLVTVSVFAATLTGCGTLGAEASCVPLLSSGNASELVSASAQPGTLPVVDFPLPLFSTTPQRSVIEHGSGEQITQGSVVDFEITAIAGESGQILLQSRYSGEDFADGRGVAGHPGAVFEALVCARVGDRIVVASPLADSGLAGAGEQRTDTIVFVIDPIARHLGKANGIPQFPRDGMPTVVRAPDGTPAITVSGSPGASSSFASLKKGAGVALSEGDMAVLHYSLWIWPEDGAVPVRVENTWETGAVTRNVIPDSGGVAGGVTPGLFYALEGAQVGSQLVAVVVPEDFLDTDVWPLNIPQGSHLIYVVDVLGSSRQS